MSRIVVTGRGLYMPGAAASAGAWLAGQREEAPDKPPCELVPSRLNRATSQLTRMLVEVVTQASADAALEPGEVPTVFASAHGEIQIAVEQMRQMKEGDGKVSPARFKNSVHNTSSGLFTLAAKNRGFTTAIAAGPSTVAMALLEAFALLQTDEHSCVVAIGEEPLPEPLDRFHQQAPLAIAFALRAQGQGPTLASLRHEPSPPAFGAPEGLEGHPVAPALALLRALEDGRSGPLALGPADDGGRAWCVDLAPEEGPR